MRRIDTLVDIISFSSLKKSDQKHSVFLHLKRKKNITNPSFSSFSRILHVDPRKSMRTSSHPRKAFNNSVIRFALIGN